MKASCRYAAGNTLAEVIASLAIAAIMLAGLFVLLLNVDDFTAAGVGKVTHQRDVSYAVKRISRVVRTATHLVVEDGGNGLRIERRHFDTVVWCATILVENNALKMRRDGMPDEILIPNNVSALAFQGQSFFRYLKKGDEPEHKDSVSIRLKVGSGPEEVEVSTVLTSRISKG